MNKGSLTLSVAEFDTITTVISHFLENCREIKNYDIHLNRLSSNAIQVKINDYTECV